MANWTLWTNYLVGHDYGTFKDISRYVNNFSWTDDKDTVCDTLTFDGIADFAEGRSHVVLKKDDKTVFSGVVTQKQQKKSSGSYTAKDYSWYLNSDQIRVYQFNGESAKRCIYKILWDNNLTGACIELNTKILTLYWGKTYIDIIKDIISQCSKEIGEDVIMEMRGTTLWIDKVSNLKVDCKYILSDDYNATRNMENMKNYIIVSNNSSSTSSDGTSTSTIAPSILATVKDDTNIKTFGRLSKVLSVDGQNEAQAKNTAQNYLNNFNATNKEFTVTLMDVTGCEDIRANRKIYIDISEYGIKGYFRVKNAQHTVNNGIHKIAVSVDFSGVSFVDTTTYSTTTTTSSASSSTGGNSKADQIIAYAKNFLGVPYVWGGKTPSGFDCSGFVAYVFNHFGYSLTAYTYTMVNQGTRVSLSSIQPADLIFFFNTGHVGIYIGNNQFIEAPHTGANVRITGLSDYYRGQCSAVVRVL